MKYCIYISLYNSDNVTLNRRNVYGQQFSGNYEHCIMLKAQNTCRVLLNKIFIDDIVFISEIKENVNEIIKELRHI